MSRLLFVWLVTASSVLTMTTPAAAQFSSVRIQVIDVGQADGILIRTPNRKWVLIDAGQDGSLGRALRGNFGVDTLQIAIGTHRHRDHIGGMDEVLYSVPVMLYVADTVSRGTDADSLVRVAIDSMSVRVQMPRADTVMVDGVRFIILPWTRVDRNNENNNSVIVRLEFGAFSMLFTGDAENRERDALVENFGGLLDVAVLKASHHGSANGSDSLWLAAIVPERVVISAGVHRRFKHPNGEAVAAYNAASNGRVYCTNRHGTVRVYGFPAGRFGCGPSVRPTSPARSTGRNLAALAGAGSRSDRANAERTGAQALHWRQFSSFDPRVVNSLPHTYHEPRSQPSCSSVTISMATGVAFASNSWVTAYSDTQHRWTNHDLSRLP